MLHLAKHVIAVAHKENQWISMTKLQEILYCAMGEQIKQQGDSLLTKRLYGDGFLATPYGVINEPVYDRYKRYGTMHIRERGIYDKALNHLDDEIVSALNKLHVERLKIQTQGEFWKKHTHDKIADRWSTHSQWRGKQADFLLPLTYEEILIEFESYPDDQWRSPNMIFEEIAQAAMKKDVGFANIVPTGIIGYLGIWDIEKGWSIVSGECVVIKDVIKETDNETRKFHYYGLFDKLGKYHKIGFLIPNRTAGGHALFFNDHLPTLRKTIQYDGEFEAQSVIGEKVTEIAQHHRKYLARISWHSLLPTTISENGYLIKDKDLGTYETGKVTLSFTDEDSAILHWKGNDGTEIEIGECVEMENGNWRLNRNSRENKDAFFFTKESLEYYIIQHATQGVGESE